MRSGQSTIDAVTRLRCLIRFTPDGSSRALLKKTLNFYKVYIVFFQIMFIIRIYHGFLAAVAKCIRHIGTIAAQLE
jgi:hypothetical protein